MTSLWPGGDCEPCEDGRHEKCIGWARAGFGFCGCTRGLCGLRLITGVLWDVTDNQGDSLTWRLAKALLTLQAEVNQLHPDRPRQSDGTIGDARHQAEVSDHNPNAAGVVTAWDITTAPFTEALAETLRKMGSGGDQRVKYVIYRARIASAVADWAWRPYSGFSPHYDHVHLSVSADPAQYDRADPWLTTVHAHTVTPPTPTRGDPDMLIFHSPSHSYARIPGWVKVDPKLLPVYRDQGGVHVVEVTDAQWVAISKEESK